MNLKVKTRPNTPKSQWKTLTEDDCDQCDLALLVATTVRKVCNDPDNLYGLFLTEDDTDEMEFLFAVLKGTTQRQFNMTLLDDDGTPEDPQ